MRRQREFSDLWQSSKNLSEFHTGEIPKGYDRCVEQQFGKVRGICESQVGRDRLEFVNQVHKDFNPGSQVQDAAHLLFRFERLADPLILPRTLQAALIFECKTHSLVADRKSVV